MLYKGVLIRGGFELDKTFNERRVEAIVVTAIRVVHGAIGLT
jgi:hypothetical protein